MAPKLSQVCLMPTLSTSSSKALLNMVFLCSLQEEFDEAVKTNIEDFDMEVITLLMHLLLLCHPLDRAPRPNLIMLYHLISTG